MVAPLTLARCGPQDFINPYPALFWSAAICAALLGLEVLIFSLTARRFYLGRQALWLSRARQVFSGLTQGAALLALVLAAWLGWQSLHFGSWCSAGPNLLKVQAFQTGQAVVIVVVWLTTLFIVGGIVLLVSQSWLTSRRTHLAR